MTTKNNFRTTAPSSLAKLIVYSREACHLCQEMIHALYQLQKQQSFDLEIIDIDTQPELVSLYNDKVPVLMAPTENVEICHYHLDLAALDAYFAKIR